MDENLSIHAGKIRAFKLKITSTIEKERDYGCKVSSLQEIATSVIDSFSRLMDFPDKALSKNEELFRNIIPIIEDAYLDWRAIQNCFNETIRMAYLGSIPRSNLAIDSIYAQLERLIGEPLAAMYAELQAMWSKHLESYPWDSFLSGVSRHLDFEDFQGSLKALSCGDDFDIEDATENLTGPLRHLLAGYIRGKKPKAIVLKELSSSLWNRPEIVIANDYWQGKYRSRIIDELLDKSASPPSWGFAKVKDFFTPPPTAPRSRKQIISAIKRAEPDERNKYLRCLILHPDQEIRRYAVTNVSLGGLWKSLTPAAVPCATILSLLEKIFGSQGFDDNFRKIFFDSIYKRLFSLTSRSEVLYARGIVRILTRLNFFLEDAYFEKLLHLIDYLESKEKYYQIKESLFEEHIAKLKDAKQKAGSIDGISPDFGSIPPVVLRKIARDGHYWYELSMHAIYRIAKETVPYINTQDRALKVATHRGVNQEVLRAIGKRKALFSTRSNMLALLSNPRTPPLVSMEYISDLGRSDIAVLLRTSTIHPELRQFLHKKFKT